MGLSRKKTVNPIRRAGLVFTALFLLILLFAVQSHIANNDSKLPKAADGHADLSDWEGTSALQIIDLQGEWEFYRQQLLTKEEMDAHANPPLVRLPHVWNDSGESPLGHATYRLRIQHAPVHQSLSIKLSKTPIFYKLFVDDQLVLENGYASSGSNRPSSVNTSKMAVFSVSDPDFDLILQVENTNYSIGGFWSTIQLGTEAQLRSLQTVLVQKESILAGGLLLLALFYFSFYLVIRKDRLSLLFAAGCLLVLMRMALQGESLGLAWIQDISFETLLVLVHLTDGWAPVPFMFLIYFIFPHESRKWPFYLHFGCAASYSVLAFILPANLLILASTMMQVVAFSIIAYGCIVVTRALYNGREGAFPSVIGFAALLLFVIHDILFARSLIQSTFGELGSFGVTVFLVAQAFALAQRYFNYYREAERLSGELLVLNQQKDDFLANTSHELKTPLNGIISLAESLQSGVAGRLNERQAHNLELIASSGRRLNHLIEDLLIYSQIKHDAIDIIPAHFRLEGIVQPILEIHRHLAQGAGKEIEIVGDIPEEMTVLADENRVVQILHNLLGNAVKYTHKGEISVCARHAGAGWIEVAVSDTGIGIPEDKQQLIFEMFGRVDQSFTKKDGGIGLGLPISKYLAELHGGTITVQSRAGLGSEFRFTLPAGEASQARAGAEGGNDPTQLPKSVRYDESLLGSKQDRPGKGLVLVVDDDPVNLQAVLNFLTLDGYSIMAAMDGKKAWEIIQVQRERLALVIVDIMMPGLSGYELCRRIRQQWTELELPVLMMTAVHGQQALQAGFEAGTNDYLTKPFEAEEFRARVRTLLQIRHTMAKVKEAELAFLQAQIKPHFLYNTLNTISTFCMKDPRQARDLIGDFATYLRHSFDFHDFGEAISLEAELELVQAYLNIEQARFGQRLHIQYLIDASMDDMLIPQLTIQPLAENAVRHGVMRKSEGGTIVIEVRREEDHCRISVRDDGVGMRDEQIAAILSEGPAANGERKGIGLKNIHYRLVQRYGSGLRFHAAGGTEVFFRIPIQSGLGGTADV